ncbi:MAG: hypothetical protein VXZ15_14300, partial [Planctomycetota bacterium]|nr:hypothetical protein [Planctomycetota bacterium]
RGCVAEVQTYLINSDFTQRQAALQGLQWLGGKVTAAVDLQIDTCITYHGNSNRQFESGPFVPQIPSMVRDRRRMLD